MSCAAFFFQAWDQLFEINDSFNLVHDSKISNMNITNTLLFSVDKMGESFAFALQRILAFYQ